MEQKVLISAFPETPVAQSDTKKILAILVLLGVARLLAAIFAPLHYDEAYYWLWSKHLAGGYYDHPPMVALLIRLGVRLFGDGIFGIRAAFLFLGLIATWPIWRGVEILFDDQRIGATAALYYNLTLAATTSMLATPDVPLIAACAFLIFFLAKLQQAGKGAWWLAAGLALGLGLMSKYTMAFFGVGVVVWLALAPDLRKWLATPWPWIAASLALAIFSPMLIWNAGHHWASFVYLFNRRLAPHEWAPHRLGEFLGTQIGMMTPPVFVLAVIGLFRMARGEGGPASSRILIHAMIWPAMLYFLWHSLHQRVEANWLEPAFVAFAAAAAVAAHSELYGRWSTIADISQKCAAPLGLLITLVLYLQVTVGITTAPNDPIAGPFGAGWKDFAIVLDDTRKKLGADVVLTDEYALAGWMSFYLPSHPPVVQINQRIRWLNGPQPDPAEFSGVMLYVCGEENNPYAQDRLRRFASVELVAAEPRTRNGVAIERYMIYRVSKPVAPVLDPP